MAIRVVQLGMIAKCFPDLLVRIGLSAFATVGVLYLAADEMRRSDGGVLLAVIGAGLLAAVLGLWLERRSS